jgi:hypothetical protein
MKKQGEKLQIGKIGLQALTNISFFLEIMMHHCKSRRT